MAKQANYDIATIVNIVVRRNDSINIPIYLYNKDDNSAVDLSTFTEALCQVKNEDTDEDALLTFSSEDGSIEFGDPINLLTLIKLKDENTLDAGKYIYDIEFSNTSLRITYVKGSFVVNNDTSRET